MSDFNPSALMKAPGAGFEADDDFEQINALYLEKGWGDGLPIVPPTAQRVERMLAYCDRPWDEEIGLAAPRYGAATPLRIAANAVMAGCRAEYFPLVMLAIEALCEEKFNLYGVNATTHPCTTLIIVNGPVAKELKMNSGHNAFGPGNQANATIGRAVRLAMLNIGGAIPGAGDMATFGTPAKYTFCAAENEDASPWEPLHVELGFARDVSTVTVFGAEGQHNVNDHESVTGVGVLKMMAGVIATTGANDLYFDGGPAVIFGPEHAATIAKDGYSKADVKKYLYEHGRVALGKLSDENVERRIRQWPVFKNEFMEAGPERLIPVMKSPDNISIIVLGGAGKHSAYIPTFGATQSVTRPLKRRNGEFARSVDDFRKK
jgi:hypothetical protein